MPSVRYAMEQGGQAVSSGSISRMHKAAFLDQNNYSDRKKKKKKKKKVGWNSQQQQNPPNKQIRHWKKKQNLHFF